MADLASKLSDDLTCAICYEFYKTPKMLPCLHRYCRDCLHSYIVKSGRQNAIPCPKCRQLTRAPRSQNKRKIQMTEWADTFPTDFLVQEMVDTAKKQRQRKNCSEHPDNPILLYCQDCDSVLCHVCAGVDHRKCDAVISLISEAENERNRLKGELKSLAVARKISQSNENKIEDYRNSLDEVYEQVGKTVQEECDEIYKLVSAKATLSTFKLRVHSFRTRSSLSHSNTTENENQREISKSEKTINEVLENPEDLQIVQMKTNVFIPEVEEWEPPRSSSCEEVYDAVVKKFKLRETIAFLSHGIGEQS